MLGAVTLAAILFSTTFAMGYLPAQSALATSQDSSQQPYLDKEDPTPHLRPPPSPDVLGCFEYTIQAGWVEVPCTSEEELESLGRPLIGGPWGVNGVSTTSGNKNHGETYIGFSQYSGETDSKTGLSNSWSIQLNTNTFTGNNGHLDWVQFTSQNTPNTNNNKACVWRVDIDTQTYSPLCVTASLQTLSSTYTAYILGDITPAGLLKTTFCKLPGPSCWSVSATDTHGLNGKWSKSSGTILGYANSSNAQFTSPTTVYTVVYISPATSASGYTDYTTGEMNNLNAGTRSTSCWNNSCSTQWYSTN